MSLLELAVALARPLVLISISLSFLPYALLTSALTLDASPRSLRQRWFARFWRAFGPQAAADGEPHVARILPRAHGLVVDVGPGAGHWLHLYDAARVRRLVAVEPNAGHHAALRAAAAAAGLADKLEVVGVGVEQLAAMNGGGGVDGVAAAQVDTVVTLQVLCGVPAPRAIAAEMYRLMKPGAQWIVFEHVRSRSGVRVIDVWQAAVNVVWPYFFNGCDLCRDTMGMIRAAGRWQSDTVKRVDDNYSVIPKVAGVLVKA